MLTLYGIKQCDTVKKAQRWLDAQGIDHQLVDVKLQPPSRETLELAWALFGDKLVNKSSTTWRQLDDADKSATEPADRLNLLQRHPTLMKRPLITGATVMTLGFDEQRFTSVYLA